MMLCQSLRASSSLPSAASSSALANFSSTILTRSVSDLESSLGLAHFDAVEVLLHLRGVLAVGKLLLQRQEKVLLGLLPLHRIVRLHQHHGPREQLAFALGPQ